MNKWLAAPAAALIIVGASGAASAVSAWQQGFESDTAGWMDASAGWYGSIERVASGTGGVASAEGRFHAQVDGDASSAPFSRFGGYSSTWEGPYLAELDVYLDPAWVAGTGFEYSVASNRTTGDHLRDFVFHVTADTSTGAILVNADNNAYFKAREDLETTANFVAITEAGWYTLQHSFQDDGGVLKVSMNVLDAEGELVFTEVRSTATDTIGDGGVVGGNRYSWFTFSSVPHLAIDNHELSPVYPRPGTKDECREGGWESFGFENQGQCVASLEANEHAGK